MARRKKRQTRPKKKNKGHRKAYFILLVVLIVFLAVYIGHQVYQHYQQEQIIEKRDNAKQLFIKQIAPEAQAMQNQYHVLASITIAQAILESDWGSSKLAANYHNLFGIKGSGADSRELSTKEYVNGRWIIITDRFKVYPSWDASIRDHARLMVDGTTGNADNYSAVTAASDYRTAAKALQQAGYATDPDYANKLISVIQTYQLYKYDR
ncbi:glycoside hydrolase family 73 protein [Limosilactobacillus difficilis]|uniref:glycoside hydrolase family 73 protein n=1 Tax=Limosilactobacillus difficilis TaxID=2991838 RepID=UPI0024BA4B11|nr:glycoside hydrolase family 73 protein [Limosilactobacillus difficilis]